MKRKYKLGIAKSKTYHYNMNKSMEEVTTMSAMVAERIRKLNLTPEQKRNLKINDVNLEKNIDGDFVHKVVSIIDKYKSVIKELSKY